MSKDIRLAIGFWDHPKTIKLKRKLGYEGVESLMRLWFFAAQYKPDGMLTDLDEDDIEIAARWNGDPGLFISTLISLRWMDAPNGASCNTASNATSNATCNARSNANAFFKLHAWKENNGYVAHSKERSEKARKAAKARWEKKAASEKEPENNGDNAKCNATSNATRTKECNAPTPNPTPNPSPDQKNNPGEAPGTFLKSDRKVKPKAGGKDTAEYFKAINQACKEILDLPAKKKAFNPYQWAQVQIRNHAHPGAVAESLRGLIMFWRTADSPWSYGDSILKTKNGNWNEADAIKIHEEMKALNPKELEGLTHGLFKNVKN